ncbi:MAG: glycoside hydrolase family 88 protein [Schwartzia sp.]|nr:glycoside hydrolase family 88 protein [Schwartzia sp. (in: firmicutes)]
MATDWNKVADKIINKERVVVERNRERIPYSTQEEHRFDDYSADDKICWWTNGFWGGLLWQLYRATGENLFAEAACKVEKQLDACFMNYNGMDHDAGFRWLPTAVAHVRLAREKKSSVALEGAIAEARNRGLLAANSLAGRFNANGDFIRAWNDWGDGRDTRGWAIIDCMMNLPLLYWASDELEDPRFRAIAIRHADTAAKHFIREDGSVRHIVGFDPVKGTFLRDYGGQGYGEGSSWTRGQGWALYGFTLSYLHTAKVEYLEAARKIANRFIERIPDDGRIPVDFDQPSEPAYKDDTAAAIAACGLLTLSEQEKTSENGSSDNSNRYREAAVRLLETLDRDSCDYSPEHDELLTKCTAAYHDEKHEFPIIYGDYYYIEAVWKLTGKELFIW